MAHTALSARWLAALASLLIFASIASCGGDSSEPGAVVAAATTVASQPPATAPASGSEAVNAANAFLDSLTDNQRSESVYAFDDPVRSNWSNLPAGIPRFDRNGVRIGDLDAAQTGAMLVFLASALSPEGYETTLGILGADALLGQSEDRFGDDNYWLAFFGEPSVAHVWGWQFGGHHLAINVTVADGRSYLSPTFVGVEPASYASGAGTIMPLEAHLQAGIALINALEEEQRAAAMLSSSPDGIYTGAGEDGVIPPVEGSRAKDWTDAQRQLLLDAIAQWVGMLDASSSEARLSEIQTRLDDTHLAWHGDTGGGSVYYRIQGPSLIIEFSTEEADVGVHYHTVYRNPSNEYGSSIAAQQ